MKLNLEQTAGRHLVTAQGSGFVAINGEKHHASLILSMQEILPGWAKDGFDGLSEADFEQLASLEATITLIGTGQRQRFPTHALLRPLIARGGGFEIMDTAAACRTFNILAAEGRRVVVGLIIDPA